MTRSLEHRGPDDSGHWHSPDGLVHLGHRRLSILDLSEAGHQPMVSHCGRYQLVYNGEIYNHLAIRKELQGTNNAPDWRGHSDSETILAAISTWGFAEALDRLNGMFAIAVWDSLKEELLLARDRLGEKPLFYGEMAGVFLFGSELKALREHPSWQAEINRDALAAYIDQTSVPAPQSIYAGIHKLQPAHWICMTNPSVLPEQQCFWNVRKVAAACKESAPGNGSGGSDKEQLDELEGRLRASVQSRLLADVPVGVFLSGGIDSSLITALMQDCVDKPVQSFTIGFGEEEYNEATHAKAVAKHLGTQHTELYVDQKQALSVIPDIPRIWDEPFADASQIPTFLVSQLTRQSVTVSLSGDGGDELFYGYARYQEALELWQRLSRIPRPLRHLVGKSVGISARTLLDIQNACLKGKGQSLKHQLLRAENLAPVFGSQSEDTLYRAWISQSRRSPLKHSGNRRQDSMPDSASFSLMQERMMLEDTTNYLPNTVLTKVDRASMAVSLETRAPLLDHELFEFAWQMPHHLKFRDGKGKWALREILYRHVPQAMVDRPKTGFGVPLDHWLRGELREWADNLLDPRTLKEQGYFDVKRVRQLWDEHTSHTMNWQYQLWPILMFQAWLSEYQGTTS